MRLSLGEILTLPCPTHPSFPLMTFLGKALSLEHLSAAA